MTTQMWALDLVDEDDLAFPMWLFVPEHASVDVKQEWMSETVDRVVGIEGLDGRKVGLEDAREILETAFEARSASSAVAMFQIWPPLGGEAVTCHIGILESRGLPDWTQSDAIVHAFDAPHVGPGLQVSTVESVHLDDGSVVELAGVNVFFDNGEVTLMASLAESAPPLIANALPDFVEMLRHLRLVSTTDGSTFESLEPAGLVDEAPWQFEEDA